MGFESRRKAGETLLNLYGSQLDITDTENTKEKSPGLVWGHCWMLINYPDEDEAFKTLAGNCLWLSQMLKTLSIWEGDMITVWSTCWHLSHATLGQSPKDAAFLDPTGHFQHDVRTRGITFLFVLAVSYLSSEWDFPKCALIHSIFHANPWFLGLLHFYQGHHQNQTWVLWLTYGRKSWLWDTNWIQHKGL